MSIDMIGRRQTTGDRRVYAKRKTRWGKSRQRIGPIACFFFLMFDPWPWISQLPNVDEKNEFECPPKNLK